MNTLDDLAREIRTCRKCPLYKTRNQAVPGEGPENARFFLVGEAPGKKEDETGLPFVGISGRFLERELEREGFKRSSFFITGAVKCRPPKNRTPTQAEVKACLPYTLKQIQLVDPDFLLLAGNTAIHAIAGKGYCVSKDSGKVIEKTVAGRIRKLVLMPHPAAAMRFPVMRNKFSDALRKLKKLA